MLRKSRKSNLQGGLKNGLNNSHTASILCHVLRLYWPSVSFVKLAPCVENKQLLTGVQEDFTLSHAEPNTRWCLTSCFFPCRTCHGAKKWSFSLYKNPSPLPSSLDTHWPRTCCSRLRITFTACCSMINLVCGFSLLRWSWHMRPSSLKASLMSRTRSRSRVLFANLRNFSRSALISTGRSSSSSPSRLLPVR